MSFKRIHIIGGPGSGKTHIAKRISDKLKIPSYELDDLYWDNTAKTFGIKKNEQIRNKELANIVKKKSWVIDGVYGNWTKPILKTADRIIILKPNRFIRSWRIFQRFVARKIGLEHCKKKETWESFKELFKWSWNYYDKNFPGIYAELTPFKKKVKIVSKAQFSIEDVLN